MKVALAIAALVAVPITAAAEEPTAPAPVQQLPATPRPAGGAPGETPETPPDVAPAADPAYGERPEPDVKNFPAPRGKDVVIVSYPERSKRNIYVLSGMAVGGAVAGMLGVYFHMDARSANDDVAANTFTGTAWTPERQDTYDRAHSSGVTAGVLYGVGGSLLLATAIAYIVTEPTAENIVIHPHTAIAPTSGGAIVGTGWSF
jgi:hypothetical protein